MLPIRLCRVASEQVPGDTLKSLTADPVLWCSRAALSRPVVHCGWIQRRVILGAADGNYLCVERGRPSTRVWKPLRGQAFEGTDGNDPKANVAIWGKLRGPDLPFS